ncbi:MAG: glycosyltransferase [Lentisphaerae bacterium]|nr:glycosyltransferase [Lentisphaerota bacterium]
MDLEAECPLISVIVRTRNRLRSLEKCIQSIRQSDYPHYEIVVVNDGSTDGTAEYLANQRSRHENTSSVNAPKKETTASLYNLGVRNSKGRLLAFTDDDCIVNKEWLEEIASFHSRHPGIMVAVGLSYVGDTSELYGRDSISGCNMSFSRELFLYMFFDKRLKYSHYYDEVDLVSRVAAKGLKTAINDRAIVHHFTGFPGTAIDDNAYLGTLLNQVHMSSKNIPLLAYYRFLFSCWTGFSRIDRGLPSPEGAAWGMDKIRLHTTNKEHLPVSKRLYLAYVLLLEIPVASRMSHFSEERLYRKNGPGILPREDPAPELYLFATARCNMRCAHCFIDWTATPPQEDIALSDVFKIVTSLQKRTSIFVTGGEPFLRKDLGKLLKVLLASPKVPGISLASNGYSPDTLRDTLEELLVQYRKPIGLAISLDGLEETHDRLRNTPGSFKNAVQSCEYARDLASRYRHFSFRVNITAMKENKDEIPALVDYLESRKYPSIFTPVRGNTFSTFGVPPDLLDTNCQSREAGQLAIDEINDLVRKVRKKNRFYFNRRYAQLLDLIVYTLRHKKRQVPCYAGHEQAIIYNNGDIAICEQVAPFGNLADWNWDLPKAWTSPEADSHRQKTTTCACIHACNLARSVGKQSASGRRRPYPRPCFSSTSPDSSDTTTPIVGGQYCER